ncbi:hypothetical protein niasHS_015020 [Heterodera schachtii]|uniref:Uncharacterized protein n=1 Tax=Heterodera schachtii TaxID=97005 RepID=A0ABD2IAD8_HETSC
MILRLFQCVLFSFCSIILQNIAVKADPLKLRPKREGQGQMIRRKSPADPCLLKCKDDYMMSAELSPHRTQNWRLDSAIGSPLHALVEAASDANAIQRIDYECSYHANFVACLEQCGTSPAAQILVEGQETLKTVCQSFKGEKEFVGFILPCLARNGPKIGKSCQLHWSLLEKDVFEALQSKTEQNEEGQKHLEEGIGRICRAMNSYTDCHLRTVAQLCHRRTLSFFVQLNSKSSAALLRLLLRWAEFDSHSMPHQWPDCGQWNLDAILRNDGQTLSLVNPPILALCFSLLIRIHFLK